MTSNPGETNDLSEVHPDITRDLLDDWETYVKETGTVWGKDAEPLEVDNMDWKSVGESVIGGE